MKVIRPFSPPIYLGQISDDFYEFIKQHSDKAHKERGKPRDLVGNIKNQFQINFDNDDIIKFTDYLKPHFEYFLSNIEIEDQIERKIETLSWEDQIWINFQEAGEFQPLHMHSGIYSMVIYVDVPEEIKKEQEAIHEYSTWPTAGQIHFVGTAEETTWSVNNFTFLPENKQILIFPATQRHLVYPFKSDVTRVSISANITSLGVRA